MNRVLFCLLGIWACLVVPACAGPESRPGEAKPTRNETDRPTAVTHQATMSEEPSLILEIKETDEFLPIINLVPGQQHPPTLRPVADFSITQTSAETIRIDGFTFELRTPTGSAVAKTWGIDWVNSQGNGVNTRSSEPLTPGLHRFLIGGGGAGTPSPIASQLSPQTPVIHFKLYQDLDGLNERYDVILREVLSVSSSGVRNVPFKEVRRRGPDRAPYTLPGIPSNGVLTFTGHPRRMIVCLQPTSPCGSLVGCAGQVVMRPTIKADSDRDIVWDSMTLDIVTTNPGAPVFTNVELKRGSHTLAKVCQPGSRIGIKFNSVSKPAFTGLQPQVITAGCMDLLDILADTQNVRNGCPAGQSVGAHIIIREVSGYYLDFHGRKIDVTCRIDVNGNTLIY
ncbi:hypothetical protein HY224_00460 [Candidatus Uhrbacteria bacterium]|nr:hypothetical protein [Candidatus Uhrbacteria bacterium]